MPSTRPTHGPFTDAPLRPTTSNATTQPSLRSQTSAHSLRSNASTASSRQRQPRDLFAPALSRRPTSRATPRVDGEAAEIYAEVYADAEEDLTADLAVDLRQRQMRRVRHGSPEGKMGRSNLKGEESGLEFVNRRPDGSFLLGVAGFGETVAVPQVSLPRTAEEVEQSEVDASYVAIARHYFANGARTTKKQEEELEKLHPAMMMRLKEQVMQQLDDERWMYEPVDRYHQGIP